MGTFFDVDFNGGNHTTVVPYGQHYERVNRKKVLKANIQYTDSNNYTYTTDSNRRISNVKGRLKLQTSKRNPDAQSRVGGSSRLPTDDGGHLIGTQFNGSGNIDNLLPQARATNRSGGEWYSMEKRWAKALKEGKTVEVDITPTFTGTSQRPDNYIVKYTIDGKLHHQVIPNQ